MAAAGEGTGDKLASRDFSQKKSISHSSGIDLSLPLRAKHTIFYIER